MAWIDFSITSLLMIASKMIENEKRDTAFNADIKHFYVQVYVA